MARLSVSVQLDNSANFHNSHHESLHHRRQSQRCSLKSVPRQLEHLLPAIRNLTLLPSLLSCVLCCMTLLYASEEFRGVRFDKFDCFTREKRKTSVILNELFLLLLQHKEFCDEWIRFVPQK